MAFRSHLISRYSAAMLLGCLSITACRPREGREEVREHQLMHTSFEEFADWQTEPQPTLTSEKAHSGRYALRIDAAHPYSSSFRASLGSLCHQRPRRLTFSAWVWVPTPQDDATLVLAIDRPRSSEVLFNKSVFLIVSGGFGEWKKVSRSFDLPDNIHADDRLVIYLWKADASNPVFTDDWELTELR